jgi:hypothetical protein
MSNNRTPCNSYIFNRKTKNTKTIYKKGSDPLIKKSLSLLIILFYSISTSVFAAVEKDTISATLTVTVTTTVNEKLGHGIPIQNALIVVIDSLGEIEGTALTNTNGKAQIPITTLKDQRFPMRIWER